MPAPPGRPATRLISGYTSEKRTIPSRTGETSVIFGQGQRIVMIGGSITDCGRRDTFAPYGNGYVSLVHAVIARAFLNAVGFEI
jgi:hypothetical protein